VASWNGWLNRTYRLVGIVEWMVEQNVSPRWHRGGIQTVVEMTIGQNVIT